jgi:hypothetical protein
MNTEISLPPLFTPILTALILDRSMPAGLFHSYARLYAMAWRNNFQFTDPLDFDRELTQLLGIRRAQARQHLRLLRFARLLTWQSDGHNRYVIQFPPPSESEKTDSDVVVVDSSYTDSESLQQQHTESVYSDLWINSRARMGRGKPELKGEEHVLFEQVRDYLVRAGVWEDAAQRIADQIVANHRRGHNTYLPGLADVLGWIAYCFADREKNKIDLPVAVLAANLNANRRCPDEYRPQAVCARCELLEERCGCEEGPERHYPDEFLEAAFRRRPYETHMVSRWGVCLRCHASPCQCEE